MTRRGSEAARGRALEPRANAIEQPRTRDWGLDRHRLLKLADEPVANTSAG
jgi:hypothetical protein